MNKEDLVKKIVKYRSDMIDYDTLLYCWAEYETDYLLTLDKDTLEQMIEDEGIE